MFTCEFWEIFKNTYFIEHLRKTTSDIYDVCRNPCYATGYDKPLGTGG